MALDFASQLLPLLRRRGTNIGVPRSLDPVELAIEGFGPGTQKKLFNEGEGALDYARRSMPILPDMPSFTAPQPFVNIGPSPRPQMPQEAQELMPSASPQNGATGPFDAFLGDAGGYTPGKRPDLLPIQQKQYDYPDAPTMPNYAPMPERNLPGEQKVVRGGMTKAGLLGFLLGGAQGAVAGAGGYQQGAQKALDTQYGNQAQRVQAQNQMLQQGYKDATGQYGDKIDALKLQMAGDDKDNALAEQINSHRMNEYTRDEGNRIKVHNAGIVDRAKAEARKIAQQRADAGDMDTANRIMMGIALTDYRKEELANTGRELDIREVLGLMNIGLGQSRLDETIRNNDMVNTRTVSHQKAMEGIGRTNSDLMRRRIAVMEMKQGAESGTKPLTYDQRRGIKERLAKAKLEIANTRDPGKAPDKFKDGEAYNQWLDEKAAREETAQLIRQLRNEEAQLIGEVYDPKTDSYVPMAPPRTTSDPGWDATMRDTVRPVTLPPNSTGKTMVNTATPAPVSRPVTGSAVPGTARPTPKPSAGKKPMSAGERDWLRRFQAAASRAAN